MCEPSTSASVMDQVRLTQANAAIDEERVVGFAGALGHLNRRGARELVGLARHKSAEIEVRVEARNIARARFGAAARGNQLFRRQRGLFFREHQADTDLVAKALAGQALDFGQEPVADPLQHKAIGRRQRELIIGGLKLERFDPGFELLGRQLLFKMGETRAPKAIHREADCVVIGGQEKRTATKGRV